MNKTAADIRAALKRRYKSPECAIIFEVAQSTGHAANRHLDAIAMELWPSRGLALNGIEIKVSKSDWRRELANPAKAEQIARFCDYFMIAAPIGVVPLVDLPSAWGLIEVNADGTAMISKAALRTEAAPVNRAFLAACLRAASRPPDKDTLDALVRQGYAELDQERVKMHAKHREDVTREAERLTKRNSGDAKAWQDLCAAVGQEGRSWMSSPADLIQAVRVVHESGVAKTYDGMRGLLRSLEENATRVREAMASLSIPANDAGRAKAA